MGGQGQFRVIIVGGSIAGLTLAHCLRRAGIDHVVLEKGADLSPQIGASIGIMPNGARILDQLGLIDAVAAITEPVNTAFISYPDGFAFRSDYPRIITERFGYPIAFLDRQKFLEILHTSYPNPSNIHTKHRVIRIQQLDSHAEVLTDSGQKYTGDLVVGADGVHSVTRSEIWRSGQVSKREKRRMRVEYACVFGISSPVVGLNPGDQVNAFYDRLTIITMHGKGGRVFWFVIKKMDKIYVYPDTVRFSNEDAIRTCQQIAHLQLMNDITFGHVWEKKEIASMTALEENIFHTWHADRLVCLGDKELRITMSQMTPNIGQGANIAIEDAAVLANLLHGTLSKNEPGKLSQPALNQVLREFQRIRFNRVNRIYQDSRFVARLHARDGFLKTLLGRYYVPYFPSLPADIASKIIADSPVITFLPTSQRTGPGWLQYSQRARGLAPSWVLVLLLISISLLLHRYKVALIDLWRDSFISNPS
ncbi:hypothetical protein BDV23DRAFT_195282 [Aspergillus alliaceus]|uniref:FAD-binding domain-containing protein n=1 Tax=Petromyces alliaceus TaxID=209559 RepID=A0A5N7CND0_PETAA|nr:hypothetical protein BDV23DRAFT_195282 [Aspergillus alliaceus]